MLTLGDKINFLRNRAKLTQKELGIKIGVPEQAAKTRISQYESGKRYPDKKTIEDLANALEVSPAFLNCPTDLTVAECIHFFYFWEHFFGVRIYEGDNSIILEFPKPSNSVPAQFIQANSLQRRHILDNNTLKKERENLDYYTQLFEAMSLWDDKQIETCPECDDETYFQWKLQNP